ncbi:DUF11 domain-containing protein [Nonomuraea candida]|uniref:DUF11 domain-containing protein n=1 Tax=Nonomuraea candida TaxID=359159 RepID=UPI000AAB40B4|nr:DUF11 domain-containing protein [Nonomuraea candida]
MIIGAESVYALTVANTGGQDAHDVVLAGLLDRNVIPGRLPDGCLLTGRATVTCGGPGLTIPAGRSTTYELPVTTDPALQDGTTLTSRVHVASTAANGDETQLITRAQARAEVELRMSAPPAASAGDTIRYTLTVVNHGPSRAANVTVHAPLQAPIAERPPECPGGEGQTLSCPIGALAPGESRTFRFATTFDSTGTVTGCATVHAAGRETRTADNRSCTETVVEPAPSPSQAPVHTGAAQVQVPGRGEKQGRREGKGEGPGRPEPRPAEAPAPDPDPGPGQVPAAADVPPPAHHRSEELPLTGASVWMLVLGVAVLLSIGLLVGYFSSHDRLLGHRDRRRKRDRPHSDRPHSDRPHSDRLQGGRTHGGRPGTDRPGFRDDARRPG